MEQLQYEAARQVTGLTRYVFNKNLVKEIGWLSLSDKRLFQKVEPILKIKKVTHRNLYIIYCRL